MRGIGEDSAFYTTASPWLAGGRQGGPVGEGHQTSAEAGDSTFARGLAEHGLWGKRGSLIAIHPPRLTIRLMCNHYANSPEIQAELSTWREFIAWDLKAPLPPEAEAVETDVWPRRKAWVVRQEGVSQEGGGAFADIMAWGVPLSLPGKRPGTTVTKYVTNIRNLDSPFWRSMLARPQQRCLVPFARFAEPKIGAGREEHWFTLKERPIGAFAGLWRADANGAKVFAFLTCEPNPLVAPLHPKAMPVILHESDYARWLEGSEADARALAVPYPSQLMGVS
ncbi:SOS response-associated peptidase family protein [Sphingorhabdus sp.]|uniref:SOS response-associated peptidase family protein n=1 Tax=Sphingorhabdus sp. TaxID=1902408 RepID=UPI0035B361BB